MNEFSIALEFEIIEEAWIAANQPASCFLVIEISVNHQFVVGFSKFLTYTLITLFEASNLILFSWDSYWCFHCLIGYSSQMDKTIVIL